MSDEVKLPAVLKRALERMNEESRARMLAYLQDKGPKRISAHDLAMMFTEMDASVGETTIKTYRRKLAIKEAWNEARANG